MCEIADVNSSLTKQYFYADSQVLAKYDCNGLDDSNHVVVDSKYFYLHDRLGSVRQVIDSNGVIKNSYTYNPLGESFASDESQATSNCFMFTGQYYDSETGEYYLRNRQYSPSICRFTSRDPIIGKFEEPMTLVSSKPGKVRYEMQSQIGGNTYSFPVIFIKDDNGNWKLLQLCYFIAYH